MNRYGNMYMYVAIAGFQLFWGIRNTSIFSLDFPNAFFWHSRTGLNALVAWV